MAQSIFQAFKNAAKIGDFIEDPYKMLFINPISAHQGTVLIVIDAGFSPITNSTVVQTHESFIDFITTDRAA
jgi:hypothetical protein